MRVAAAGARGVIPAGFKMDARESSRILAGLLLSEHRSMADFLVALAEFDHGRLWVQPGIANLFEYLHREHGRSRGSAHYRKVAVQLVQKFPEVVEPLRSGKLCITAVLELAKVITPQNRAEVLPKFFHLSKQEAKAVAVEIRPAEVVPRKERVTTLPPVPRVPAGVVQPVELEEARRALGATPPTLLQSDPLTSDLRRLHMTVSKQFLEKLEAALELLLATQAMRRAEVKTPQRNPRPSTNPGRVPAASTTSGRSPVAASRRSRIVGWPVEFTTSTPPVRSTATTE
jgi:hypothetical protein